jgi:hypothetical protein
MRMTKNYTTNDLLLYYYGELDQAFTTDLAIELLKQPQLLEQYNCLIQEISCLNIVSESPSDTSIELVMAYANKAQFKGSLIESLPQ